MSSSQAIVVYRGQSLDILAPGGLDDRSLIVQEEVQNVRRNLDAAALADGFLQLDWLLQCALNGVVAAKETELEIGVFKLQDMFVDLVGKAYETVQLFESRSRDSARATTQAFHYLFKGRDSFAIRRLAACEKLATEMEKRSNELANDFTVALGRVEAIIEEATHRKGDQQKANKAATEKSTEFERKRGEAENRHTEAKRRMAEARNSAEQLRLEEEKLAQEKREQLEREQRRLELEIKQRQKEEEERRLRLEMAIKAQENHDRMKKEMLHLEIQDRERKEKERRDSLIKERERLNELRVERIDFLRKERQTQERLRQGRQSDRKGA